MIPNNMTKTTTLMRRPIKALVATGLAMGLAACAPSFNADVSRFQAQLPAPQGQSFAVVAEDPALAGGLEFALDADLVAAEMAKDPKMRQRHSPSTLVFNLFARVCT